MSTRAPLSVTFYLEGEERERFRALHEATTGLDPEDDTADGLKREGLVEDDGPTLRLTTAGFGEKARLTHLARTRFEERRRQVSEKGLCSPGVERPSARTGGRVDVARLTSQGARVASPAIKHASAAPHPDHREPT